MVETEIIAFILTLYGFDPRVTDQKSYIHTIEEGGWMKLIFRVTLDDNKFSSVNAVR